MAPKKYEVEVILAARVNEEPAWEFLVKWWGYPESDNTWEPHQNVKQCERLLDSFWLDHGKDEEEYTTGDQVNATAQWIQEEKKYFLRTYGKHQKHSKIRTHKRSKEKTPESYCDGPSGKLAIMLPATKPRLSPVSDNDQKSSDGFQMISNFDSSGSASQVSPTVDSNSQPENIRDSAGTEVDMTLCNIEQYAEPQLAPVEDRLFGDKSPQPMLLPDQSSGSSELDDAATARLVAEIDQMVGMYLPTENPFPDMSEVPSDSMLEDPVERHPPTPPRPKPAVLPRIPRVWGWVGALMIDVGHDHARKLCTIRLSEPTATLPNGLSLDILLATTGSISITKMLHVQNLDIVLSACANFCQTAKLSPENKDEGEPLDCLASYMQNHQKVAIGPLFFENQEVACILIFTSTIQALWHRFNVPIDFQQSGTLLATLIPWTLTSRQYSSKDIRSNNIEPYIPPDSKCVTTQAIRGLGFPDDLKRYMKEPNHPYCVWWSPNDGTMSAPGLETILLHDIMKSCRAKKVRYDSSGVRVVFVHVAALRSLHQLANITKTRNERPEVHFYTYGSHPNVPKQRWGVRAVYPLGGIVTFTPGAIVEDPIGTAQLMRQIAAHPFWDCYLLPSVVGMAVRFLCEGLDPISEFQNGYFVLHDIIMLMAEGDVSLLRAPSGQEESLDHDWVRQQVKWFALPPSGLLKECLDAFSAQYANVADADICGVIDAEISEDLLRLQSTHPQIIENYRRFVAVETTTSNATGGFTYRDGVEWTTLDEFDIRDGFLCESAKRAIVS